MISFWSTTGEYGCFSNFSQHPIKVGKRTYKSNEHYYQSQKFEGTDPLYALKIAGASSPKESARLGRNKSKKLRADWESVKLDVMRSALRAKVEQHHTVRVTLMSTGSEKIVENSPYDFFWGIGDDGSGKNWLGRLWMELRTELVDEAAEEQEQIRLREGIEASHAEERSHLDFMEEDPFAGMPVSRPEPKVWNQKNTNTPRDAVFVGRPSPYGNPYVLEREEEREEVIKWYEEWLLSRPDLVIKVKQELRGKNLVCFCAPRACHGDVLLRVANEE